MSIRLDHAKIIHEKILCIRRKKLSPPSEGPYQVSEACANGTVKIQRGGYREIICIARITPFFMKPSESNDD